MSAKKRKSKWWTHFVGEGDLVVCELCKEPVKTGGGTTNLKNHLKHNHFSEYFALNNQQPQNQDNERDSSVERQSEEDIDGDLSVMSAPSPSPSPSPTPGRTRSGQVMSPPPLSPSPTSSQSPSTSSRSNQNQRPGPNDGRGRGGPTQTRLDFKLPDSKTSERLHMAVAYFISTCNMPYSLVERDGFLVLCANLRHGYKPPGRKALTNTYVPKLYATTREGMLAMLKDVDWVSLTSDAWTSKAQDAYMSLTSHFISVDWNLYAFTLCCRALPQDHTGLNLKEWFVEALKEWKVPLEKVTCFTTDNGDSVRLAVDLLGVPSMRCFGHTLQNGTTTVQNMPEIKNLKMASHRLQQFFTSTRVKNRYKTYVEKSNGKARTLPAPVSTRWWSELPLLRVLQEDDEQLRGFLATYDSGKSLDLRLTEGQRSALSKVLATLGPLEELCTEMCGSKYVTASSVLPVIYLIEKLSENAIDNFLDDLSASGEGQPDRAMLKLVLAKLYKRYSPTRWAEAQAAGEGDNDRVRQCDTAGREVAYKLLVKCSYVDGRFREDLKPADIQSAREQLLAEVDVEPGAAGGSGDGGEGPTPTGPPPKKKKGMASLFAKFSAQAQAGAAEQEPTVSQRVLLTREMDRFELLSVEKDDDILAWWKVHEGTFPILSKLARKYLAVPATSTESERLFSQAGLVISYLRTCLTGEHAEQLIFLSMNKDFVPKPS